MVATFFFLSLLHAYEAPPAGAIELQKFDYGKPKLGTLIQKTFSWKNDSKQEIVIAKAWTSCACVSLVKSPTKIALGKTEQVEVNFNAHQPGKITQHAYFQTSTGALFMMTLDGEVIPVPPLMSEYGITVEKAAQETGALLIDLRSADRVAKAYIPSAVRLSPAELTAREEWKSKTLILIDEGYSPLTMLYLAQSLRKTGFLKTYVLAGGIRQWQISGRKIEGSQPWSIAFVEKNDLSRFDIQKTVWMDAKKRVTKTTSTNQFQLLPWSELKAENFKSKKYQETPSIVASSLDGCCYEKIEKNLSKFPLPLFYLAGGSTSLDEYMSSPKATGKSQLVHLQGAANAGSPALSSTGKSGCGGCPK